jgi:hypothetical protein
VSLLDPTIYEPLPAWGTVTLGQHATCTGWIEETEIGGARFVSITPNPGHGHKILVNAFHVDRIDITGQKPA